MVQLEIDPIGERDLTDYLDTKSDFAFELKILKLLTGHGFICEHCGTYDDPVEHKPREFDLRAIKYVGHLCVRLAVECKNIGANFPLLISCLPRQTLEAFHEIIAPTLGRTLVPAFQPYAKAVRLPGMDSIYKPNALVGKTSTQVGKKRDGTFHDSDNDIYKKWAQAVSSAQDLVDRAHADLVNRPQGRHISSLVLPILIVPDGTLWQAEFDANGSRLAKPRQVDRCSYFIDKSYVTGDNNRSFTYKISHLEFMTPVGLVETVSYLFSEGAIETMFPADKS